MQDRRKIARLLRDLEAIKSAVKRNRAAIREIAMAPLFWWLILGFGVAVVVLSLLFQYLLARFGSYAAIPLSTRAALWTCLAAAAAGLSAVKIVGVSLAVRRVDPGLSLWSLVTTQYPGALHVSVPVFLIATAASVYFGRIGQGFYIVGILGLGFGLVSNVLAVAAHMTEYLVYGYWLLVTAGLSFFFPGLPAPAWAAICLGGGAFAFVLVSAILRQTPRGGADE